MAQSRLTASWKLPVIILIMAAAAAAAYALLTHPPITAAPIVEASHSSQPPATNTITVAVAQPRQGDIDRITKQPGSVQAFESVQLYAGVSGFLKTLSVDIGDRIKKGQLLARVDVPELDKQVQRGASMVEQTQARVTQMKARAVSARAEWDAARAAIPRAEAMLKSKTAELRYRQQQLGRMRELAALKSIEDKLVDEYTSHRDAVREAEIAAQEGVTSAKANLAAMAAKIQAADADVQVAEAEVRVAEAELQKAKVMVQYATVSAPFDGVVTQRNFFPSDFVRAANEGGAHLPLLVVQRTDLMRVVVQIPDRDVPFCDPGDRAIVEIDALPGEKPLLAKVARVAQSEDPETRLMRVEIDVSNPTGKICHGMYGRVTIVLDRTGSLTVPSSCLVGRDEIGKGALFVVRDGIARQMPVTIGADNGLEVAVFSGIRATDKVILRPASGLRDGSPVVVTDSPADSGSTEKR